VRAGILVAFGFIFGATAIAQDWGQLATISSTLGVEANRLCVGEGLRASDIGCPTYAPYISATSGYMGIGLTTPTAIIETSSNESNFAGTYAYQHRSLGVLRTQLRNSGIQTWYLNHGSGEVGRIEYSTPGSYPGIVFFNAAGNERSQILKLPGGGIGIGATSGSGNPWYSLTVMAGNKVGVNAGTNPIATLDVVGTISASDAIQVSGSALTCTAGIPGAIRYESGNLELCNGSSWTALGSAGGSIPDRIVSGSTQVVAISDTNYISITTSGVNTGYIDPAGRVVVPGISVTTNQLSATTGYFSGRVGIGTVSPSYQLEIEGADALAKMTRYNSVNGNRAPAFLFDRGRSGGADMQAGDWLGKLQFRGIVSGSPVDFGYLAMIANDTSGSGRLVFVDGSGGGRVYFYTSGEVGIGTSSPLAKLDVNGTISASSAIQISGSALTCTAGIPGAIRYESGNLEYCNGVAWAAFATSGSSVVAALNDLSDVSASEVKGTLAMGSSAGLDTWGTSNTVIGYSAGTALAGSVFLNTIVGAEAMAQARGGWSNVVIGAQALSSANGVPSYNTVIGVYAGQRISGTAGTGRPTLNTALGFSALQGSGDANGNTASRNVAIGNSALGGISTGSRNVAVGDEAGYNMSSGISNTFIGSQAGYTNTTGSGNILLGLRTMAPTASSDYALNIGNSIFGDMANAVSATGGRANIGINWVTPTVALEVSGTISATRFVGDGSGLSGVAGVSTLASLTDVSISSPGVGHILRYDGSEWTQVDVSTAMSTTTILPGWPDAIVCDDGSITRILHNRGEAPGGVSVYQMVWWNSDYSVTFTTATKEYSANSSSLNGFDCLNKSISELYDDGQAFNFIGGIQGEEGAGGSGNGDRIVSDTTSMIANDGMDTISVTTGGTTHSYFRNDGALVLKNVPLVVTASNILFGRTASANFSAPSDPNVGFGFGALNSASLTGGSNTAVGYNALSANTSASGNTAVGFRSQENITTGAGNTSVGTRALVSSSTGWGNVAVGFRSLNDTSSGYANTAVGLSAMEKNTTGYYNTSVGQNSLFSNTTGYGNVALGSTLFFNTTGDFNTGVGFNALSYNVSGSESTAVGRSSFYNSTGSYNTGLGYETGLNVTIGTYNTLIGHKAGDALTTGSHNLVIGAGTDAMSNTGSHQLNIGNSIFGSMTNASSSGGRSRIGINWNNPSVSLEVSGTISATRFMGDGSGLTGVAGVSTLASLTDVSISSPGVGHILRYDGSEWTQVDVSTAMSTTTMVAGWPDAIMCNVTNPNWGKTLFLPTFVPTASSGNYYYRANVENGTAYSLVFNSAGSFNSYSNITASDCNTSIAALYAGGQAFNFIGGTEGSGGSASGDRIVSGTTQMVAISNTGYISITTSGLNTGYIDPAGRLVVPGVSVTTNQASFTAVSIRNVPLRVHDENMMFGRVSGSAPAGIHNVTLGVRAGDSMSFASSNTMVGTEAGYSTTFGSFNTGVGVQALYGNTVGGENTAVGGYALSNNTVGSFNSALGNYTLTNNISGEQNVAVGFSTLTNLRQGDANIAIGANSLSGQISSFGQVAIGVGAMYYISGTTPNLAQSNTVVGHNAMRGDWLNWNTNSGSANTILGFEAGYNMSSGSNNILLGYQAGDSIKAGSSNILIGSGVDVGADSTSSHLNMGNSIFGNMTNAHRNGGRANIGINWVTPSVALEVSGTISATRFVGDGSGLTGVAGVSTLLSLTDVSDTAPIAGGILRYNGSEGEWETVDVSTAMSTTTMVDGFPDAISCENGSGVDRWLYLRDSYSGNTYYVMQDPSTLFHVAFNSTTGAYSTHSNMAAFDCVTNTWSISDLYAQGRAFNFIGGIEGSGGSGVSYLTSLTDVSASAAGDGQVLAYDSGTSSWVATNAQEAMTFSCPSGFTLVQNQGQTLGCIQNTDNAATTWNAATLACYTNYGGRLPDSAEWYIGVSNNTLTNETGNWEWLSDYAVVSSPYDGHAMVGSSSINDFSYDGDTGSRNYRCFIPASGLSSGGSTALGDRITSGTLAVIANSATSYISLTTGSTNWGYLSSGNSYLPRLAAVQVSGTNVSASAAHIGQLCDITGGNCSDVSAGLGVSYLASLTDVSLTNLAGRDYLRYDAGSGKWVNISESTVMSTTTMAAGWPDAIRCSNGSTDAILYHQHTTSGGGAQYARPIDENATRWYVNYDSSGAYSSSSAGMGAYDCVSSGYSIAQLYGSGDAFNFIGNSGADSGGSAEGDRIVSDTTSIIANDGMDTVSITTAGITNSYFRNDGALVMRDVPLSVTGTNIFLGRTNSLDVTPTYNVGIGLRSLNSPNLTSYGYNTAVGFEALRDNVSGFVNTGVGHSALASNTTGYANTAFGTSALSSNLTGSNNVAVGSGVLRRITASNYSVAVGTDALGEATTGAYNTAVGQEAARGYGGSVTGSHNTAIGGGTLHKLSSGEGNTALGELAGFNNNSGRYNILLGYRAGYNITSGSSNTIVGSGVNALSATGNYQLNINNTIFGNYTNASSSGGRSLIGINWPAPTVSLEVSGTISATRFVGDGSGLSGVSGVSTIASLTDVQLTNLAGRDYLRYDAGSGKWVNISESTVMSTTTMVPNWPDAIVCNVTNPAWGMTVFRATFMPAGWTGTYLYRNAASSADYDVAFNADGTFNTFSGIVSSDCNVSISALYAGGKAFNFIGNSGAGSGGSAEGDRIVSDTTSIIANDGMDTISITTAGVTTGYFTNSGRLVVPGISVTTNQASVTSLYASNQILLKTAPLKVSGDSIIFGTNSPMAGSSGFSGNTSFGINALRQQAPTFVFLNTAVGASSMASMTSGRDNTAVGNEAMGTYTIGSNNTAVGSGALKGYLGTPPGDLGGGDQNVAVGSASMLSNNGGSYNVAIGADALAWGMANSENTAVGQYAAHRISGTASDYGTGNTAVGRYAMYGGTNTLTTADFNVSIGHSSGYSITAGRENVMIGHNAGYNLTTASATILIGAGTRAPAATTDYALNIGNSIFGDMSGAAAAVGGSSNIGINWVTPTVALEVSGTISATAFVGDGSGLTNLPGGGGGQSDRIVSDTTSIIANDGMDTISITTAGVTTGYFTNTGRLVIPGISVTTNQLSGTTGYFSQNLRVAGSINGGTSARIDANGYNGNGVDFLFANGGYFRTTEADIKGSRDVFFQAVPTGSSGYGFLETWEGAGMVVGTGGNSAPVIFQVNRNERMRLTSTGFGIGTMDPSSSLHVAGVARITSWTTIANNVTPTTALDVYGTVSSTGVYVNGDIQHTGVITDVSDRRLKTNIELVPDSLEKMLALQPVRFEMKNKPGRTELGFIAQDVEKLFPELVMTADDVSGTKSLNYTGLIAPMVKSVQQLNSKLELELKAANDNVTDLRRKLDAANDNVELLRSEVDALRQDLRELK